MVVLMKKIIWIIDDNKIDQLIACKLLESYLNNISIHCYSSPGAALKELQQGNSTVSVILLDLDMPIMDGWDFLHEFQKLAISIPLYILSCSLNPKDKLRAKESQLVKGFLIKPLLSEQIFTLVNENALS